MNPSAQVQTQVSSLIRRGFPLQNILTCLSDIPSNTVIDTYDALRMDAIDASMWSDGAD